MNRNQLIRVFNSRVFTVAIIGIIVCCDKRVRATGSDARRRWVVIAKAC